VTAPTLSERLLALADGWQYLSCDRGGAVADLREAALELARLESQLEAVRLAKAAPFMGER
jgi:hypothetical protein